MQALRSVILKPFKPLEVKKNPLDIADTSDTLAAALEAPSTPAAPQTCPRCRHVRPYIFGP
jgi:hypothetical protein